jgi:hypothetical protein
MSLKKFKGEEPFPTPELAAKELIRIAKAQMEETGYQVAYTGRWNSAFTSTGGSVEMYVTGRDFAIDKGWLMIDGSGTRVTITPEGEDA